MTTATIPNTYPFDDPNAPSSPIPPSYDERTSAAAQDAALAISQAASALWEAQGAAKDYAAALYEFFLPVVAGRAHEYTMREVDNVLAGVRSAAEREIFDRGEDY